jgi:predicted CoA-substrate-specific enzyme activase
MPYCLGIDIGSRNTKIVLLNNKNRAIVFSDYADTGVKPLETVNLLIEKGFSAHKCSHKDIVNIYATGYGRKLYQADKVISEISCHAFGVQYFYPQARTIIDIGGQDSKIISIDDKGHVRDFVMNDKCAAGTGRFLEMVALRLGVSCDELDKIAALSKKEVHLNSTCVVFAESEIIGLVSEDTSSADIARSVHLSIAERIVAQLNQLDWKEPVVFTGGVAFNQDLRQIISYQTGAQVLTPLNPELTGALGAALIALNDYEQS